VDDLLGGDPLFIDAMNIDPSLIAPLSVTGHERWRAIYENAGQWASAYIEWTHDEENLLRYGIEPDRNATVEIQIEAETDFALWLAENALGHRSDSLAWAFPAPLPTDFVGEIGWDSKYTHHDYARACASVLYANDIACSVSGVDPI
jgi:hypothetical protein